MTSRLPAITAEQLARVARRLTSRLDPQKGSHAIYYREHDRCRILIPMHAGKILKPKTLAGILHDMGLTPEELRSQP